MICMFRENLELDGDGSMNVLLNRAQKNISHEEIFLPKRQKGVEDRETQ